MTRLLLRRHPNRFHWLAACSVVTLALGLFAGPAVAAPASHAGTARGGLQLVGLGDSYASGLGTGDYYPDSGDCYRSPDAYAVLDAQALGASIDFVACSGATSGDVVSTQLSALSATTTDVTLTVGGNDIGFTDVITQCALPSWASHCFQSIHQAEQAMQHTLPGALDTLYADIHADAPNAEVAVVGYPRLFNGHNCSDLTFFSKKEMASLNSAADMLDQVIGARAKAHGFGFADPRAAFVGHAVCDNDAWLNDLTYPVNESFHPKKAGQSEFATLSEPLL